MFQGFVYRDTSNTLCIDVTSKGAEIPAPAANIIFLAKSEDEGKLRASVDAVYQIARQIEEKGAFLTAPAEVSPGSATSREYYVYAYTRKPEVNPPLWADCFYIGKGYDARWTAHVHERAQKAAAGTPPKGRKAIAIQSWIDGQPVMSPNDLRRRAAGSFVHKVGVWRGKYAELQSFAVEYFLIAHHFGPHAISNETGGNMEIEKVKALARPAIFDQKYDIHNSYWEGAVREFCKFPETKKDRSLWKPAILLLHAEKMIDQLDAQLAQRGIFPHDMRGNGGLSLNMMLRPHCQVDGSSDATINYSMPGQTPYRLQLKLSATRNEVRINMRPQRPGAAASREFQNYIDSLALEGHEAFGYQTGNGPLRALYGDHDIIKDRKGKPFFKPFAQDATGRTSPFFDIADTELRSVVSTTNWIEGEFSLNLVEAMMLIFGVFRCQETESKAAMSA